MKPVTSAAAAEGRQIVIAISVSLRRPKIVTVEVTPTNASLDVTLYTARRHLVLDQRNNRPSIAVMSSINQIQVTAEYIAGTINARHSRLTSMVSSKLSSNIINRRMRIYGISDGMRRMYRGLDLRGAGTRPCRHYCRFWPNRKVGVESIFPSLLLYASEFIVEYFHLLRSHLSDFYCFCPDSVRFTTRLVPI